MISPCRSALLCCVALSMGTVANADPILLGTLQVTSGRLDLDWTDVHLEADLDGRNFDLFLVGGLRGVGAPSLSRTSSSSVDFVTGAQFSLQMGEQVWDVPDATFGFHLDAGPATFFPFANDSPVGSAGFPFAFRGSLTGTSQDEEVRLDLVGRGESNFLAVADEESVFLRWGSLQFEDTAPIPEPSTLILLGIAAGAAVARRAPRQR